MSYEIDYTVLCEKGKVRGKNQDNFWCAGKFLDSDNDGLNELVSGKECKSCSVFAVFDGMGGENHGEIAAYIAAKTFDSICGAHKNIHNNTGYFLLESCYKLNEEICLYSKINRSGNMGTTAAVIAFGRKEVYICNIGDSKIYRYSEGTLTQLTVDHIMSYNRKKKPALTQHLGIPRTEFVIEPHISSHKYNKKDRYLICSDGLTDMVTPEEIKNIIASYENIPECANKLMSTALTNGGIDNITVILCEIKRKKGFCRK